MIYIEVNDQFSGKFDLSLLEKVASFVLDKQNCDPNEEMTIVIEDNEKLRELNHQFLGIDDPTDVLSFPADEVDPETGNIYLGDVIISFPKAEQQAAITGHSVENELTLLVVHGTLHLLGYDHDNPESKTEMWAVQSALLTELNLDIRSLPE